mgnify:FL=1
MGIILRQNKGSELTFAEVDGNFQSLYYSSSLSGTDLQFFFASSSVTHSIDLTNVPGFTGVTVESGSTVIDNGVQTLNFLGSGVASITSQPGNQVDITLEGGGGGSGTGIFELISGTDIYSTTSSLQVTASTYQQSSYTTIGVTQNPNNAGTGGGVDKYGAMFSQSVWHYTDNIGYPTSKAWQTDLNGSYFNQYDQNTDTAEILRFIAGLLSASAPDTSPNTRYYANTTEVKQNTGTTSPISGYVPINSTFTTINYLNSKGFATPGQTIFQGISPIYNNQNYSIQYTSVAGGSTLISSSVDTQLFGLGAIGVAFNVAGTLDRNFADNSSKTQTAAIQSLPTLTKTGPGTANGLTIGDIISSDPLIPNAYQDGKFVTIFQNDLYNNGVSFTTKEATGYYQLSSSIGIQSGSSNFSTYHKQEEEIFYTPIDNTDFPTSPTAFWNGSASLSATSRSLSGAPYLQTAEWKVSSSILGLFDPLYAASPTFARIIPGSPLTYSTLTANNPSTLGVYQGSTSGGRVQTDDFIYNGATPRNINTIPAFDDVVELTGSLVFNAGNTGACNVDPIGVGSLTFTQTTKARSWMGTESTYFTNTYEYFKPGTYGQNILSGSMGVYGRAQGSDTSPLAITTTNTDTFSGENNRIVINDNLLTGSFADGDKITTGTFVEYQYQPPLELQIKPGESNSSGALVTPGGTYKYWLPANPSANTYQYYARAYQRPLNTGASGISASFTDTSGAAINFNSWQSTSNGHSIAFLFSGSGAEVYSNPRLFDPTENVGDLLLSSVTTDNHINPFTTDIDLFACKNGNQVSNQYRFPLLNGNGMTLDQFTQDFIVIIRYKGDPVPISQIQMFVD